MTQLFNCKKLIFLLNKGRIVDENIGSEIKFIGLENYLYIYIL